MLRFIAHTIIGGHLQWQVYRQDLRDGGNEITVAFYIGDSVDFTTVLSDRNKVKSLKELEGLLGQNKIDWIHPGEKEWLFDSQAFTVAFDSPDIKSLDWLQLNLCTKTETVTVAPPQGWRSPV